jgi:hypothetical protein
MTVGTCVVVCLVSFGGAVGDGYELDWYTIDGGGQMWSEGGVYALGGTIGQPDAGAMSGGTFVLTGGFWFGRGPGDCDSDGDVDLDDFAEFESCLDGPGAGLSEPDCGCYDFDSSGDIDLDDFAEFQAVFTG